MRHEVYEETGIRVSRCKPSGGSERPSEEPTAVAWLTPEEVADRTSEVYAVRRLDALAADGPHVRNHDGRQLIETR